MRTSMLLSVCHSKFKSQVCFIMWGTYWVRSIKGLNRGNDRARRGISKYCGTRVGVGRNWRPHSPWWGPPELHGLIPHIRIMAVTGAQRGMNHVVTKNSFISNVRTNHTWTSLPRLPFRVDPKWWYCRYSRWKVRTHIHMKLLPLLRDSDRECASCRIHSVPVFNEEYCSIVVL